MTHPSISKGDLEKISELDTCTVANAIERLNLRMRNEGFASGAVRCRFPDFKPMLGYAVTGRIRTSSPPISGRCYYDRIDFWRYLATLPAPRVIVFEDVDEEPGFAGLVGEVHASIALALDCAGYVTNGAVRDLAAVKALGFHMFSGSVAVSHAYAHIVEFGEPVEIGGLKISPGDLIHGDCQGVQMIPIEAAAQIPEEAANLLRRESQLTEFCRSPRFSLAGLEEKLHEASANCL